MLLAMQPGSPHRFANVVIDDLWCIVDASGVWSTERALDADIAAHRGGAAFHVCHIADDRIAVFVRVPVERRASVAEHTPAGMAAVVFADADDTGTTIELEIAAPPDAPLERCAFAATVAQQNLGNLRAGTSHVVHVRGGGVVEVTLDFDWDAGDDGAWSGEARVVVPSARQ